VQAGRTRGARETVTRWWLVSRRVAARHVVLVDSLIAVLAGGSIVASTVTEAMGRTRPEPLGWLGSVLVVVAAGALVVRRRATLVGFVVTFGAMVGYLWSGNPFGPVVQLVGMAGYALGAWLPVWVSAPVCMAAVACYLPLELVYRWAGMPVVTTVAVTAAWLVLPWLVGAGVRAYRWVRLEIAEADRREYGYEERLRVAREVHDVVGHTLAVVSMQAGVALHRLERRQRLDPEVAAALRAIREASRSTLGELRATLTAFPEPGVVRPQPGLDALPALVDKVGGAALEVVLTVDGERGRVPAPVDLAAYRIAQEALTNVVRHAAARHVAVRVVYGAETIELTVTDDGDGADDLSGGRGLAGMRERARAAGGTLRAGSRAGGHGFEMAAVLPRAGGGP
jgi:signal transduction histidine kinase